MTARILMRGGAVVTIDDVADIDFGKEGGRYEDAVFRWIKITMKEGKDNPLKAIDAGQVTAIMLLK